MRVGTLCEVRLELSGGNATGMICHSERPVHRRKVLAEFLVDRQQSFFGPIHDVRQRNCAIIQRS